MIDPATIRIGQKVHYIGFNGAVPENGMVKSVPEHSTTHVFVVYKCNGDWENFQNYTGQSTPVKDLHLGWNNDSF